MYENNSTIVEKLYEYFDNYKQAFEQKNVALSNKIANNCETFVMSIPFETYCDDYDSLQAVLEVACFVFEQSYKYDAKTFILKKIIDSQTTYSDIKIRALENILFDGPSCEQFIGNTIEQYRNMLSRLTN